MSTINKETGLRANKETVLKMAAQIFFSNKRCTEIKLRTYNRLVVMTFAGSRKEESEIAGKIKIVRVINMEDREIPA